MIGRGGRTLADAAIDREKVCQLVIDLLEMRVSRGELPRRWFPLERECRGGGRLFQIRFEGVQGCLSIIGTTILTHAIEDAADRETIRETLFEIAPAGMVVR